jgi:hypothetical protein
VQTADAEHRQVIAPPGVKGCGGGVFVGPGSPVLRSLVERDLQRLGEAYRKWGGRQGIRGHRVYRPVGTHPSAQLQLSRAERVVLAQTVDLSPNQLEDQLE